MSRFRLRFLLQEFDLPEGEVFIGRSPECQITIDDPLISRKHAKILVQGEKATLVDLGSRNGSRLNGRFVQGSVPLADSDRIRLGGQELVFFELGRERRAARATSAMIHCRRCSSPFPEGAPVCPHCGTPVEQREEETVSGLVLETRRGWVLQLVGEVFERAVGAGRAQEAEKVLRRAVDEFEQRRLGEEVDLPRDLAVLGEWACRCAQLAGSVEWIEWVAKTYEREGLLPPARVLRALAQPKAPGAAPALQRIVRHCRSSAIALGAEECAALEELERSIDRGH